MYRTTYNSRTISPSFDTSSANAFAEAGIWMIIALVLAIIGGILVYFMFVKGKNKFEKNKFLSKLKEFLDFKTLWIEPILKISYLMLAIFVTLGSFAFIGKSFLTFLMILTLGNVVIRLAYEGTLVVLMIWKNTAEINKKMAEPKTKGDK